MKFFKSTDKYQEFSDKYFILKEKHKEFVELGRNTKFYVWQNNKVDIYFKYFPEETRSEYNREAQEIEEILKKNSYKLLAKGSPESQLKEIDNYYALGRYDNNGEIYFPGHISAFKADKKDLQSLKPKTNKHNQPIIFLYTHGQSSKQKRIVKNSFFNVDSYNLSANVEYTYFDVSSLPAVQQEIKELKALDILLKDNDLLKSIIEILDEKINYINNAVDNINYIRNLIDNEENELEEEKDELKEIDEVDNLVHKFAKEII